MYTLYPLHSQGTLLGAFISLQDLCLDVFEEASTESDSPSPSAPWPIAPIVKPCRLTLNFHVEMERSQSKEGPHEQKEVRREHASITTSDPSNLLSCFALPAPKVFPEISGNRANGVPPKKTKREREPDCFVEGSTLPASLVAPVSTDLEQWIRLPQASGEEAKARFHGADVTVFSSALPDDDDDDDDVGQHEVSSLLGRLPPANQRVVLQLYIVILETTKQWNTAKVKERLIHELLPEPGLLTDRCQWREEPSAFESPGTAMWPLLSGMDSIVGMYVAVLKANRTICVLPKK